MFMFQSTVFLIFFLCHFAESSWGWEATMCFADGTYLP